MTFLRKRPFFSLERRFIAMDMGSTLFFLLRVWGNQIPSLLTFSIFFSRGGRLWIGICYSQVLILRYFCANCITLNISKYVKQGLERIGLVSSLAGTKLRKPVSDLAVINDTLTINTTIFLDCFCSIFVILKPPQHNMSNMHFQSFDIWGGGDHKLNYDTLSFTIDIRMIAEGNL